MIASPPTDRKKGKDFKISEKRMTIKDQLKKLQQEREKVQKEREASQSKLKTLK
jgi:hypothetical protein